MKSVTCAAALLLALTSGYALAGSPKTDAWRHRHQHNDGAD